MTTATQAQTRSTSGPPGGRVAFLAGNESAYTTGQIWAVNAGLDT
jgi:hypothetical protein